MEKLRIGIVGCGNVATQRHAPSYKLDKRCKLIAALSPRLEDAKAFSKKFSIPSYYNSLGDFLSERLDVVSICTPPFTHGKLAISCMKEGFNVLVEKPMAMKLKEALEMVEVSRKQMVKLSVCHNFLFSHSMLRFNDLNKRGKIGRIDGVLAVQISNMKRGLPKWYPNLPGGLFFDESPHMLYLMRYFIPELRVHSVVTSHDSISVQSPRKIEVYFVEEEAKSGLLTMDFGCSRDEWFVYVIAEKALIKIDLFKDTIVSLGKAGHHDPLDVLRGSIGEILKSTFQILNAGFRYSTRRQRYGHDILVKLFLDSVIQDIEPPVKPEEGLAVVSYLQSIIKKMRLRSL
jgi:predicted dehydrogenase